mgnify:CR=1 FL=1
MSANFTPLGMKVYQGYENDRNVAAEALIEDIVREVFGARKCIVAHHITFVIEETRTDQQSGLQYQHQLVQELPCIDGLIFDHDIARKIWGEKCYRDCMIQLALEPIWRSESVV